jgi:hypothetical protein
MITKFERTILNALLTGELPELSVLRDQAQAATVEERKFTGVGFFTTLSIPPEVARLNAPGRRVISDVGAELADLKNGAGFLLFIQDGQLDFLEGFTYDEPWPAKLELQRWYYLHHAEPGSAQLAGTSERDLGGVASMLAG